MYTAIQLHIFYSFNPHQADHFPQHLMHALAKVSALSMVWKAWYFAMAQVFVMVFTGFHAKLKAHFQDDTRCEDRTTWSVQCRPVKNVLPHCCLVNLYFEDVSRSANPHAKKKKKKTLLGYLHIECSWHVRNKLSIQWCPEKKSSWDRMRKTYEKARLPRLKKMFSDPGDWASFICKHCLQTTASASLEDTNLRHIAIGHKQPSGW